jgi:hypothetical protein
VAKLVVIRGRNAGEEHPLPPDRSRFVMGRKSSGDVQVLDEQASREHAEIVRVARRLVLRDLGSSNGTLVNGRRVDDELDIGPGDRIGIGETVYELVADPGEAATFAAIEDLGELERPPGPAPVEAPGTHPPREETPRPATPRPGRTPRRPSGTRAVALAGAALGVLVSAVAVGVVWRSRRQGVPPLAQGGARREEAPSSGAEEHRAPRSAEDYRAEFDGGETPAASAHTAAPGGPPPADGPPSGRPRPPEAGASAEGRLDARAATTPVPSPAREPEAEEGAVPFELPWPEETSAAAASASREPPAETVEAAPPEVAEPVPAPEAEAAPVPEILDPVAAEIRTLTGARTRIVWVQDAGENRDTFCRGERLRLFGFDTDDGKGERAILPLVSNFAAPMVTPKGDRVVFSNTIENVVYLVNWDGTGLKPLVRGVAADLWIDPGTGVEWVYVQTGEGRVGRDFKKNPIWRCQIDDPRRHEVAWRSSPVDIVRYSNFQLSADGTRAGGAFPWNHCGVADLTRGVWDVYGRGCWASLAPDDSYVFWHFDGRHRNVYMFEPGGQRSWRVAINGAPGIGPEHEVYHPRWSNNVRFLTMTGPYIRHTRVQPEEGRRVEIYLGRFSPDLTFVEQWAMVSRNDRADFYPDAWVAPAPLPEEEPLEVEVPEPEPEPAAEERPKRPASWPTNLKGLAFRWENGAKGNQVVDPLTNRLHSCRVRARGRARPGRHYVMELAGGAFVAESGAEELLAACRATDALTVEFVASSARPVGSGAVMSFSSGDGRNFTVSQTAEKLLLRLRTSRTGQDGSDPPVELCRLPDDGAHHVVVSYGKRGLVCCLDGRPVSMTNRLKGGFDGWGPAELAFGDEPDGGADWAGRLEGVAIYNRALSPEEARANFLAYGTRLEGRAPVKRIRVLAELLAASSVPDPDFIQPYWRALVVNVYEVRKVLEGDLEEPRVAVAHWAILDRRVLPEAERKVGSVLQMTLEPFDDNPQLQSELLVQTGGGYDLPLYYDAGR